MRSTRRQTLVLLAGATLPTVAWAEAEDAKAAIAKLTNGVEPKAGRVKLDIPEIADNGNAVPVSVTVESPMTAADHVTGIHLVAPRNPLPMMMSFRFGPRAGKAAVATGVRLATSQHVTAIATMSDGTAWSDSVEVLVTIAACIED